MKRINIDASLFTDVRFQTFFDSRKNRAEAVGSIVLAWIVAQKYWYPNKNPVPIHVWKMVLFHEELEACGLAKHAGDGVYVVGSEEQFEWLFKKRKAGLASSANREIIREKVQQCSTVTNTPQPHSHSHSLNTENILSASADDAIIDRIYKLYPKRVGDNKKKQAIKKIKTKKIDLTKLESAIKNYSAYCDETKKTGTEFVKMFLTFLNNWEEWENNSSQSKIKNHPAFVTVGSLK